MKKLVSQLFKFCICIFILLPSISLAEKKFVELETNLDQPFYVSDAAYFKAADQSNKRAVIFVPGFIFNKESWFSLAKKLQNKNVSSLAINAKSATVVDQAIDFLNNKKYQEIVLIGGSSGAAAVLNASKNSHPKVRKIVTLSAVRGKAILAKHIDKLFIVSEGEKSFAKVQSFHKESTEPKQLKTFAGNKHAQFLFKSEHGKVLTDLIVDFVLK